MPVQPLTRKQQAETRKRLSPQQLIDRFSDQLEQDWKAATAGADRGRTHLLDELAGSAGSFMAWLDGDPLHWCCPAGYQTRLAACAAWLAQTGAEGAGGARPGILTALKQLWPQYSPIHGDWNAFRTLWQPDPEFGPLDDRKERYPLPLWSNPTVEAWDCTAGALVTLNHLLGRPLLDLEE